WASHVVGRGRVRSAAGRLVRLAVYCASVGRPTLWAAGAFEAQLGGLCALRFVARRLEPALPGRVGTADRVRRSARAAVSG
ncbi:MAG: hypothetical protein II655_11400, partial [Thermoguttaceae bacterium]|nr:hypothetical protein [Thermoguttaceae bacterium]